ncbi:piggyBac transposable element-derived protein 4-like [Ceratina calcarata]|uniref:PiggyBac transposable element-derived protein 4-like n=1 Tax=Ceratina calcarata TaxID=156304 RepID=A0AAJ7N2Z2_9HYME|nr:piggyBac transposable element-derived protein 4-like [Ceratina calcarata]
MTRNKKLSLGEYWSRDKLLRSDIFGEIMPRDRYFKLLSMLHFNQNITSTNDKLYKIRNVIDMLRKNFSKSFYPYQKLCIDESLLLYKGRLSFKQYIPSKRSRFGIKSFILCDCRTGYIQDLIVYAGSSTMINSQNKKIGKSGAIVEALMAPYLGKGHTVFLDNWYSNMVLSTINSTRKSLKWYRKYFFHLLDICVWNAYCLYKHNTRKPISMAKFHLNLIRQILQKYRMNMSYHHQKSKNNPLRLIERHFPSLYKPQRKNRNRRCVVCTANDKRRESRYECKDCNVGLCVEPCFRIYHTELQY